MPDQPAPPHNPRVQLCMAVEVKPGTRDFAQKSAAPLAAMLNPDLAGALAARVAADLVSHDPASAELELITCGALYDPVEVLRPVWRLHEELEQLAARAPRKPSVAPAGSELAGQGRVIAFGAADGKMPGNLQPDPEFGGGPLLLLPVILKGSASVVSSVSTSLERDLLENGMASAETALLVQEAFGVPVEHVRYLTAWDLAAMMHLQYQHAGFGLLWPIIEAVALTPAGDASEPVIVSQPPEPELVLIDGEVHLALETSAAWLTRLDPQFNLASRPAEQVDRMFTDYQLRQRQLADILHAHGVAVVWDAA